MHASKHTDTIASNGRVDVEQTIGGTCSGDARASHVGAVVDVHLVLSIGPPATRVDIRVCGSKDGWFAPKVVHQIFEAASPLICSAHSR